MIAKNIRCLCKERGISVADLEKSIGIGKNSIYCWDKSIPAVDKVKRVADYFGVTVDELLKEEEKCEKDRTTETS